MGGDRFRLPLNRGSSNHCERREDEEQIREGRAKKRARSSEAVGGCENRVKREEHYIVGAIENGCLDGRARPGALGCCRKRLDILVRAGERVVETVCLWGEKWNAREPVGRRARVARRPPRSRRSGGKDSSTSFYLRGPAAPTSSLCVAVRSASRAEFRSLLHFIKSLVDFRRARRSAAGRLLTS